MTHQSVMTPPSFLPEFPPAASPLALFGLLLLAGLVGRELVNRVLRAPRIVGCVLTGLFLGASGLDLLDAQRVQEAGRRWRASRPTSRRTAPTPDGCAGSTGSAAR